MSCLPSLSPDAGECASGSPCSRGTQPAVHSADHDLEDHRSAVMAEASGSVLPWGGLSEEAATPGHPLRVKRVLGNPPAIHPREPPETTGLPQCFGRALRTSHASNAIASDCERLADFLQGVLAAILQPETHLDDFFFARSQRAQHLRRLIF